MNATHKQAEVLSALDFGTIAVYDADKVYGLEQGGEEWLRFREGRITATDVPLLLGTSPYGGLEDVIKNKFGGTRETAAMRRGMELEPELAAMFQADQVGFKPCPYPHRTSISSLTSHSELASAGEEGSSLYLGEGWDHRARRAPLPQRQPRLPAAGAYGGPDVHRGDQVLD